MSLFKRDWTPAEADEWTRHDLWASVLSSLAYILLMLGTALTLLALPVGYLLLGLGLLASVVMYKIIDPKLQAISTEYEKKQKAYLERIEKIQRWERP